MHTRYLSAVIPLAALLLVGCTSDVADEAHRERPSPMVNRCTPQPSLWPTDMPAPTRGPDAVKRKAPSDEKTCLQEGGSWGGPWYCNVMMLPGTVPPPLPQSCWDVPTTDGCRPCTDDRECEGWCYTAPRGAGQPAIIGMCSPIARPRNPERIVGIEVRKTEEGEAISIQMERRVCE